MANFLKQMMRSVPFTVMPDTPIGEAIALMSRYGLGYAVVAEHQQVKGLLTETDVVRWVASGGDGREGAIAEAMTPTITIHLATDGDDDEDGIDVFERMQRDRILYLPVVDGSGRLLGVVTLWDVVQALERLLNACTAELQDERHQRQECDRQRHLAAEHLASAIAERQRMEETLKRNEAQNRAILSAIPDLLCILESDGTFREVIRESTTLNNLIHDLPDDVNPSGQHIAQILPPDLAERQYIAMQEAIATGQVQSYEQAIAVAGRLQHEDVRISPIDDNSILLMIRDIGDRKRSELERQKAEKALRESEARFQEIAHTIDQKFFIRCAKTCDFLYVSPGYERLYGRSVQSLYENPDSWLDAVHPDDQSHIRRSAQQQFSQDSSSREFRIIHADGTVRWIATHIKMIRDEAGNPNRIIGLAQDITDRKHYESVLSQYELIVNATTDGVVVVDRDYRYQLVNQAYLTWHQKQAHEVIGQSVSSFLGKEFFDTFIKPRLDQCLQGDTLYSETLLCSFVEPHRYFDICFVPYREKDGTITGVVATLRDLSDLKRVTDALFESEIRNRAIVEALPDLLIRVSYSGDVKDFVLPSDNSANLYIQPQRNMANIVSQEVFAADLDAIQTAIDTDTLQVRELCLEKDGKLAYEEIRVARISDDEALMIIRDITERKQIEDERKQSEAVIIAQKEFLQSIINAIPSSVFVKDEHGRFLLANKVAADVYDISQNDIIGLSDFDLNPNAEQVEQFLALNRHVMQTRQTCISDDQQIAHPQQGLHWYQTTVSPWIDSSEAVLGIIGNCIDITERKQLELDLQESKERLNDILASAGVSIGYFRLHPDGRWETLYHSQGCEEVFGYAPTDFLAEVWLANVVPEDVDAILNPALDAIRNGQPITIEYRFRHRRGGIRWISDTLTSRWDAVHHCWIVTAVGSDVSDRKRIEIERWVIEEALRQENQFRSQIIDQMAEGLCVFHQIADYPYIQFSVWNQRMTDITGYTQDEINAYGWYQQLYPDLEMQTKVIERMADMDRGNDLRQEEWVITCSDGAQRTISISTTPLGALSGVTQVLAVIEDVSDRRRAEAEVETQRKLLRQVIDSIPSLIFARDRDGRFVIVNQAAAAIHGVTPDELIGRLEQEVSPLVDDEWTRQMMMVNHQIMDSGEITFIPEEPLVMVTGETRWYQTNLIPFMDAHGDTLGIIGTSVDISDRKQIEQSLQQSLREKEVLLSEVHHRVKNNLQVIISLLNLQALRINDPFARQTLENSGDRVYAMALVHEKLYRTRHFEGISLSDYIHNFVDHLVQTYESPDRMTWVKYTLDDAINLPLAQAMQFSLILNELITNALKYGDTLHNNRQPLYVELEEIDTGVVLRVGNHGSLPADFSLSASHQNMGLRLVQVLAEQLNGTIHLDVTDIIWFSLQFIVNRSGAY